MKKVMCILENGFEELEAIGSMALLKRAGIEVDVYTFDRQEATGRFGFCLANIYEFSEANYSDYDGLLIPGGPHHAKLEENTKVKECIHWFDEHKKLIAAICAAPTILGHMGLLKGKNYTCFTSMNEDFNGAYKGTYVCVDGNLITGKSAAASIVFGFAIISYLLGEEKANEVKQAIYYEEGN